MCSSPRGGRVVVKRANSKVGPPIFRAGISELYSDEGLSKVRPPKCSSQVQGQTKLKSEKKVIEVGFWSQIQHWLKAHLN